MDDHHLRATSQNWEEKKHCHPSQENQPFRKMAIYSRQTSKLRNKKNCLNQCFFRFSRAKIRPKFKKNFQISVHGSSR